MYDQAMSTNGGRTAPYFCGHEVLMLVSKVGFHGYQRLVDTSCSTAGKMIAFLGPNEAGKTTVLRALDWFSNGSGELPLVAHNKSDPPTAEQGVVEITYWLEPDDVQALRSIGLESIPKTYQRDRYIGGSFGSTIHPPGRRDPAPFEEAQRLVAEAADGESAVDEDEDESEPRLSNWSAAVDAALLDPQGAWEEGWDEAFQSAVDYLDGQGRSEAVDALETVRELLNAKHPDTAARQILEQLAPKFILFTDDDRDLRSTYDLSDEALRQDPPKALSNLAWVADLDLSEIWDLIETDQKRNARTAERRANEFLTNRLSSRWSQKELNVEFNIDGTVLEVQIFENADDGAITPIGERSDGLITFVALVAFLARHDFAVPPVLLVDEAETHLHYDAQADLVEVLTNDIDATQVFYTTHSPGCLPRDLGTGIRLVSPMKDRSDASRLRNDFWTTDSPGFTPLLFAMGAGAAAFSAFRKAVLTEGASDMILLPSLMRLATNRRDLDFQVAPGIANYHGSGLELEEIAARVVYLVDGDPGGDVHRTRLLDMGIPNGRVMQFEAPKATEDYVHPDLYLALINELIHLAGHEETVVLDDLDKSVSIGKAIELWCGARAIKSPGKTVVASQLIAEPGSLKLAEGAREALVTLHTEIMRALNVRPKKAR